MTLQWPNGARAALTFSYDDGYPVGASIAAPQLEAHGLRGTFYLTWIFVQNYLSEWRRVADAGHELGNHTMTHPHEGLGKYTAASFMAEQTGPLEHLMNVHFGNDDGRTYRYIGGVRTLGLGTVSEQIAAYEEVMEKTFIAASPAHWETQDPLLLPAERFRIGGAVPTWTDKTAATAIRFMDQAFDRGHWALLTFHDIVAHDTTKDRETSQAVHEEIIEHGLSRNFWIAPFREVYDEVVKQVSS